MKANKYEGRCATCGQIVKIGLGVRVGFGTEGRTLCAIHQPKPPERGDHYGWHVAPLAALDFESTGVNPREHRIISFAGIADRGDDLEGMVNPGVPIPVASKEVHGISEEDIASAPQSKDGLKPLLDWLDDVIERRIGLVIFNAPYDLTLLRSEVRRLGLREPDWDRLLVIDPLVIDWGIERGRLGPRKLVDVARYYGVDIQKAHDAACDAKAARDVAIEMSARHADVVASSLRLLVPQQRYWAAARSTDWNKYLLSKGRPLEDPRGWPFDSVD